MSNDDNKVFRVWLPLFRIGDDFQNCYEHNNQDPAEGFRALANVYAEAASMCKRLAGVIKENPGYTAQGDAHMLWVEGPLKAMEPLIQEGIVAVEEFDEYAYSGDEDTIPYDFDDDPNDGLDDGTLYSIADRASAAGSASIREAEDNRILDIVRNACGGGGGGGAYTSITPVIPYTYSVGNGGNANRCSGNISILNWPKDSSKE